MNLPLRLKTIGDFIEDGEKVADVGADHGLLELYLLGKYPQMEIVAIDNKVGPYKNLQATLGCFKNVRLSLSDGLTSVDKDCTTLVLAGMGGLNIQKILKDNPQKLDKITKIITDAHRDPNVSRKTIVLLGYKINKEILVYEEEKFYVISEFIKSNEKIEYSDDVYEFGYEIYNDKLWPSYKEYLKEKNEKVIANCRKIKRLQDKVLQYQKLNERLEIYGKD